MKSHIKSSKVNRAWLNDHVNDTYVKLAKKDGYRARAAYKLKEIDEVLSLIKAGQMVIDLGSTPGAWSQYVSKKLSFGQINREIKGKIIALDILPMVPIEGVVFIQGDFTELATIALLDQAMEGRLADVVISDMAPNLSGISSADASRIEYLVELAIDFAETRMNSKGTLVAKVFHGGSYESLYKRFSQVFSIVKRIKPKASRDKSAETFLIGIGLKRSDTHI